MKHRRFSHLFADLERRIERRCGALGEVCDVLTPFETLRLRIQRNHVLAEQPHFAAREKQSRLGVAEGGERDCRLAGPRLADQGNDLARLYVETHPLYDRDRRFVVGAVLRS